MCKNHNKEMTLRVYKKETSEKVRLNEKRTKPPKSSITYSNSAHVICSCGSEWTLLGNINNPLLLA